MRWILASLGTGLAVWLATSPAHAGGPDRRCCDGQQAVAAARKLIADGVVFAAGHLCSGAAIPASALYQEVGIVMISPSATNPKLTEQGFRNVFSGGQAGFRAGQVGRRLPRGAVGGCQDRDPARRHGLRAGLG